MFFFIALAAGIPRPGCGDPRSGHAGGSSWRPRAPRCWLLLRLRTRSGGARRLLREEWLLGANVLPTPCLPVCPLARLSVCLPACRSAWKHSAGFWLDLRSALRLSGRPLSLPVRARAGLSVRPASKAGSL